MANIEIFSSVARPIVDNLSVGASAENISHIKSGNKNLCFVRC